MSKFTITANITFEVEAEDSAEAAAKAWHTIEWDHPNPENILVWDEEPNHWFAERYTYANPPVHIVHTPVITTDAPIPADDLQSEAAVKVSETEGTEVSA
jgi:hypothetical protein